MGLFKSSQSFSLDTETADHNLPLHKNKKNHMNLTVQAISFRIMHYALYYYAYSAFIVETFKVY